MALTDKNVALLRRLAEEHKKRISDALHELERRVAAYAIAAPVDGDQLFDLAWSLRARNDLRQMIEETYLAEVQSIVEEYPQIEASTMAMLKKFDNFVGVEREMIVGLQTLSFRGFEAIASQQLETLAEQMYQYTLIGGSRADMVEKLRQQINGVYMASDKDEIQRLVEIAQTSSNKKEVEAAVEKLHKEYAADRTGTNMRRYATQMTQDSIMQFHQSISKRVGDELGVTRWRYSGSIKLNSRDFCIETINGENGRIYTTEELKRRWQGSWGGKSGSDPWLNRGGYNCTHVLDPVVDE